MKVVCVEDGQTAELVPGSKVYPHRPDLYAKWFWVCPCGAKVGCHQLTKNPLGSPANATTQGLRRRCHVAFDALWQAKVDLQGSTRKQARKAAYLWLSDQLGLEPKGCHFGMMDAATCRRALEVLE